MTAYFKDKDKNGAYTKQLDIDLTKYNLESQNLIKDILKIMGYEE